MSRVASWAFVRVVVSVQQSFKLCCVNHLYADADGLGVRGVPLFSAACSSSVVVVVENHAWYGHEEFPAVAGFRGVVVVCVMYDVLASLFQ